MSFVLLGFFAAANEVLVSLRRLLLVLNLVILRGGDCWTLEARVDLCGAGADFSSDHVGVFGTGIILVAVGISGQVLLKIFGIIFIFCVLRVVKSTFHPLHGTRVIVAYERVGLQVAADLRVFLLLR